MEFNSVNIDDILTKKGERRRIKDMDKANMPIFTKVYTIRKSNPNRRFDKHIANELGINSGTLTKRKKNPGSFTLAEFCHLTDFMSWTDDEILAVVRRDIEYLPQKNGEKENETT